jgi:hypothetical protein
MIVAAGEMTEVTTNSGIEKGAAQERGDRFQCSWKHGRYATEQN